MRHSIILVRLHGEEEFRVHSGREVPIHVQRANFKQLLASRTHPEIAEAEIWYSDGSPRRTAKFSPPAPEHSEQEGEDSNEDSEAARNSGGSRRAGRRTNG